MKKYIVEIEMNGHWILIQNSQCTSLKAAREFKNIYRTSLRRTRIVKWVGEVVS